MNGKKSTPKEIQNCGLQHYGLEQAFDTFHEDYVNKTIRSHVVFPPSRTITVKGTKYAEYVNGKLVAFDLDEMVTKYEIKNAQIQKMDLVSIRAEFSKKAIEHGLEQKRKMIKAIEKTAPAISVNDGDDILEKYFQLVRKARKIGPTAVIMSHPKLYEKITKELEKPENQERIKRELKKIENEQH